ncbi:MAG: bestrophin family ion channel [Ferruginibacter sp.]
MVQYNPKDWLSFIFRFPQIGYVIKLWPMILLVCFYSSAVAFFEINYWQWSESNKVKNIVVMHSLLGFVISLLLVFRTNTAYDRWWEAEGNGVA